MFADVKALYIFSYQFNVGLNLDVLVHTANIIDKKNCQIIILGRQITRTMYYFWVMQIFIDAVRIYPLHVTKGIPLSWTVTSGPRMFWFSWLGGVIVAGIGPTPGQHWILSYSDPPLLVIHAIGVSKYSSTTIYFISDSMKIIVFSFYGACTCASCFIYYNYF